MSTSYTSYKTIIEIVGDIVKVRLPEQSEQASPLVRLNDLAVLSVDGSDSRLAQIIDIKNNVVSLQVFDSTKGLSTDAKVNFLNQPMKVVASDNILGRVFSGKGEAIDNGPSLEYEQKIVINGPIVNPVKRQVASKMIRTNVPMIDVFNCLVESQKIPIFSVSGEPYNTLLARIGIEADADLIVFGGLGLIFDDYHYFKHQFENAGMLARSVMFVNQASDSIVERLLIPDLALSVAEHFAVEHNKRVLVLLTDMTAYADALKEVGIANERVPSNRGYMGDLYSQLARRYEKACDFTKGGSITVLSVTTMPGGDVTHPVPDNTGYITEGQFYLHDGIIDPFGSLSRLKQQVIGKQTREDHHQVMNTMIRFYSGSIEAKQKQSMAFELNEFDEKLLRFGELFKRQFLGIDISMPLETALDTCWEILKACFSPEQLLMKKEFIDKYYYQKKS
ncbi:V-type ATP synthase subunit B [Sessilibacter corallicola]|uniref:V-type ATP synthase subunit B n=1 Tax=Sessilibacter corallicola TaxID=2904075 RepID=UPI001E4EB252|nr:V-type ATP synthase subunit B [Sessilibacter corallicola]MCE2029086.1 V-type ATP synthase subunit B [Sessilibacter corallicola]